jgi:hypothetical protein
MGADPAITPTQVATAAPALRVIDQQSSCSRTTSLASAGGIARRTCGAIAIEERPIGKTLGDGKTKTSGCFFPLAVEQPDCTTRNRQSFDLFQRC